MARSGFNSFCAPLRQDRPRAHARRAPRLRARTAASVSGAGTRSHASRSLDRGGPRLRKSRPPATAAATRPDRRRLRSDRAGPGHCGAVVLLSELTIRGGLGKRSGRARVPIPRGLRKVAGRAFPRQGSCACVPCKVPTLHQPGVLFHMDGRPPELSRRRRHSKDPAAVSPRGAVAVLRFGAAGLDLVGPRHGWSEH
ncbi:hypothetical protein DFJ73DRAFT_873089 [Zopfochytrium polystomum]|nr:hypothetical protein DFJ73DRAFT_873089 [Zopfochytrium polystomum]